MRIIHAYRRVLSMLGADKRLAVYLGLANIVLAGLQFLDPVLFGRVIGLLANSDTTPHDVLWRSAATLIGIWIVVAAVAIGGNILTVVHAERMSHRNRLKAMSRYFSHVLSLPLSFHGEAHSGRLMKVMLAGADSMFSVWLTFFREQLATYVALLVLLPLTLLLNWQLSLVLIVLVVLFCGVTIVVINRTEEGQRRAEFFQSSLAGTAQDALANVMVVQSFTRLAAETSRFGQIADQVIAHQFPVLNWWAVVNVLTRGASTIAVIVIVLIGTILHVEARATVAEIVTFMGFANLLISRLESAMQFASRLFLQMPGLDEYFGVLDAKTSVPEPTDADVLDAPKGEVAFEAVSFGYPGGPAILRDVSFVAQPGSVVALVGTTGAGKSTAMNLLQRLWDPTAGRVAIDGQDIRHVTLESLRSTIGVVFQESLLFNRSIRENLRIGRPEATDAEVETACKMADAHDFIARQPQGYDTMVGERGATLSGGQRQRLAIARALLKNPPILVLDEATSALDAATEARVSRAMATLMEGRTTFIIAHRLSTVRDADEILVFDGGEIVERGRFDTLVARGGRFAQLVATQLAGAPHIRAAE
ncbi:glucan ABC transporter ATP-binding protein/ permease [Acidisphaera sp. L21]|uniref:glucan ABC transporter ATP-binding protein/ permease n=1 Tax=Acidisphaera sp. L21 TaxID=1641851 RepID=UPI00131C0AE3|nr:glucan ABC transporter ATP-binding protein/ permease [Acidisphaera sp. L21]